MTTITSNQNSIVKYARSLHQRKNRVTHNAFLAEGTRTVTILLENGFAVEHVLITPEYERLQTYSFGDDIPIEIILPSIMDMISAAKTAPGIIGVFTIPKSIAIFVSTVSFLCCPHTNTWGTSTNSASN